MANATFTDESVQIPQESLPNFRAHLVASIEHMIGLLDALDAHCDLEDDDALENDAEDACEAGDDGNPVYGVMQYGAGTPDDAEEDDPKENEHDQELEQSDCEPDRWYKTAKDKRRIAGITSPSGARARRKGYRGEARAVRSFIKRARTDGETAQ